MSCDVGKATQGLENELWCIWSDGKFGEWALLIGIDFDICPWSYRPVSEPLFWLLITNPHCPCWSKKRKHNYQKKASSRNAIRRIAFMNYVMKEYTNLNYMNRWAGVLFQRLNEIYIENTPGTHSDTCNIKTVPVILNGLGVQHVHFPWFPSVHTSLVQSDTKWLLISAMCHMGKKLALKLSFANLTRLNRCPYLYYYWRYQRTAGSLAANFVYCGNRHSSGFGTFCNKPVNTIQEQSQQH